MGKLESRFIPNGVSRFSSLGVQQMLSLHKKQDIFAGNIARLILWAQASGYQITCGEFWRTPEQAKLNADKGIGISNSLHLVRLAADLNVFVMGKWLRNSADLKPLGDAWKSFDPLNRWGGDFKKPDGNHFSMEHNGIK
jgi:hypothetical protein